jgi:bacillithiol synthase
MGSRFDLPFRELPQQSKLFLSYIERSPEALAFYRHPPEMESLSRAAHDALTFPGAPRQEISGILLAQNEMFGAGPETLENARTLADKETVAIVTGQQVGVFGGPLYTIYKTLTALRLVSELRLQGISAVPLFWMDSEDHDLAEVTHVTMAQSSGRVAEVDLREQIFGEVRGDGFPVGSIQLPMGILSAVFEYAASLPAAQWKSKTVNGLGEAYAPGFTLAQAFAKLLTALFAGSGLVIFDPQDPEAKRLAAPLFRRVLERSEKIRATLQQRNKELEMAGFAPQVKVPEDATVLFFLDQGRRRALTLRDGNFELKSSIAEIDFAMAAERQPELISPNVLLRPVLQDWYFPTVAYVAGPAEIAYFAQVEAIYSILERPMPVIWPRAALTLVSPEIAETLREFGLQPQDCFQESQALLQKMITAAGQSSAMEVLQDLENEVRENLGQARPVMASVDTSLDQASDTATRKILHQVDAIRGKYARIEAGRNGETVSKANRLAGELYPNGALQERAWGVPPYLARCGPSLLEQIGSELNPARFVHQILYLCGGQPGGPVCHGAPSVASPA